MMDDAIEKISVVATNCFVYEAGPGRVLLGLKKRGFGTEKWNGFGGKVHHGETVEDAAKRELFEECGLIPERIIPRGVIEYESEDERHEVHLFLVPAFKGEPVETEEMRPRWFKLRDIPFEKMWDDARIWLPELLTGKVIRAKFIFKEDELAGQVIDIS